MGRISSRAENNVTDRKRSPSPAGTSEGRDRTETLTLTISPSRPAYPLTFGTLAWIACRAEYGESQQRAQ
jgi:hypothetical protein